MLKSGADRKAMRRSAGALSLLAMTASCVPAASEPRLAFDAPASFVPADLEEAPPPVAQPLLLQPLAPDTALAMNAAIPVSDAFNPPARPFRVTAKSAIDRMRSLECLTAAVYYEAASESDDGQRAVAQVVLNRVRHPTYPNSVCGVVYQGSERSSGCQFSFTCDGSLMRTPSVSGWARARRVAAAALAGSVFAPVGHATHYHTHQVFPHWAPSLLKSAVIGAHIFYRWTGGWGMPAAFRETYAGVEPIPGPKPPQLVALPVSAETTQAEIAAIMAAAQYVPRPAPPPLQSQLQPQSSPPPFANSGAPLQEAEVSRLPESHVLEAWRNSGKPRDQVPTGAK